MKKIVPDPPLLTAGLETFTNPATRLWTCSVSRPAFPPNTPTTK